MTTLQECTEALDEREIIDILNTKSDSDLIHNTKIPHLQLIGGEGTFT